MALIRASLQRAHGRSVRWERSVGSAALIAACLLWTGAVAQAGSLLTGAAAGTRGAASPAYSTPRFANPVWSPDGRRLALSGGNHDGVYVLDTTTGGCLRITDAPSSGYAYNWSADGRYLGFKLLMAGGEAGSLLQAPVLFDVTTQQLSFLHGPVARAGVPSFSRDGWIAFTIDQQVHILDAERRALKTWSLGTYVNLAPIAPNGASIAYNDRNDQVRILNVADGTSRTLTGDAVAHFGPSWSPDSGKLVVSTLTGRVRSIEVTAGVVRDLDEGTGPSWSADSRTVLYCRTRRVDGVEVLGSEVCTVRWDAPETRSVLQGGPSDVVAAAMAANGVGLATIDLAGGNVDRILIDPPAVTDDALRMTSRSRLAGEELTVAAWKDEASVVAGATRAIAAESGGITLAQMRVIGAVPYLHQVYDTPNWFDGNWACGATSAAMGLAYYGVLPYWDCTVSTPYSHVSHYGRYVCETYTFNGNTYNVASPDPDGDSATGGYGYIVRNDWADTKGYMRDYLIQHGMGSSVDWSPTWSELQAEVNNSTPFVLLNSLTSAGHYILTIGYLDSQRTAIFNDPYGNKNSGYMNYNGAGVSYDWPGYSNGYSNLNTVHCFIYCRGAVAPPSITQSPAAQSACRGGTASFNVSATGGGTLSYQWQKAAENLTDAGHYAGTATSTLTLSSADESDVAAYRCVVTNSRGSVTSGQAAFALLADTAISQQPVGQRVAVGATAQISVVATGAGTLSYQWRKNAVNLLDDGHVTGASTATLSVQGCTFDDAAKYACVVTAGCGVATSNNAALAVGQPGDFNADNDVDQEDWGVMQACLATADLAATPGCKPADLNGDGTISGSDALLFITCRSSPGMPALFNCIPVP